MLGAVWSQLLGCEQIDQDAARQANRGPYVRMETYDDEELERRGTASPSDLYNIT